MSAFLKITDIRGREILDSRGNPTVAALVTVQDEQGTSFTGSASVPSGASTGRFEAVELRDAEPRYFGLGVTHAVENIEGKIKPILLGENAFNQSRIDRLLVEADGTENKANLGANAMLGVSLACARAAAEALKLPLYRYLGGVHPHLMPIPMMNILNGGAHAGNNIDIQEFMIMPLAAENFREGLRWCAEIYHTLGAELKKKGLSTAVGDEGGFAPDLSSDEDAIEEILNAVEKAGYSGKVKLALDAAGSEWATDNRYRLPKRGQEYDTDGLIVYWENLIRQYPIFSIEDPLGEEDFDGWAELTARIGSKVQIVGDDLFVTNLERLQQGIDEGAANAILIKPNQIGTLSETLDAIDLAKRNGYKTIISHRSGET